MNYLQIWIGNKPDKNILNYMKSVLNKVEDKDTYTLISDNNFLDSNINWININEYIDKYRNENRSIDILWDKMNVVHKSNLIRILYASEKENVFYVDCDVEMFEKIVFINKDKPYFAKYKKPNTIDSHVFFNGSHTDIFKKILDVSLKSMHQNNDRLVLDRLNQHYNILNIFLRLNECVYLIDDKKFKHYSLTYNKLCGDKINGKSTLY